MGFLVPSDFRWILPQETDANSPVSEELMSQLRENIESVEMGITFTGKRAVVTNNGGGTNVLTVNKGIPYSGYPDIGAGALVGLILDITSGVARGNRYIITANTSVIGAGSGTITGQAGINFQGDGIVVNDTIMISYIIDTIGHTHDGVNSAPLAVKTLAAMEKNLTLAPAGFNIQYNGTVILGGSPNNSDVSFTFQSGMQALHFDVAIRTASSIWSVPYACFLRIPIQTVPLPGNRTDPANPGTITISSNIDGPEIQYNPGADSGNPNRVGNRQVYSSDITNRFDITSAGLIIGVTYSVQLLWRYVAGSGFTVVDSPIISLAKIYTS